MDFKISKVGSSPNSITPQITIKAQPVEDEEHMLEVEVEEEDTETSDPLYVKEQYETIDLSSIDEKMSSCSDTRSNEEMIDTGLNMGEEAVLQLTDSCCSTKVSHPVDQTNETPFSSELTARSCFDYLVEEVHYSGGSANCAGAEDGCLNHREVNLSTASSLHCTSNIVSRGCLPSIGCEDPSSTSQLEEPEVNLNNKRFSQGFSNLNREHPTEQNIESTNSNCICPLSKVKFSALPKEEQMPIFLKGRPTPPLPNLIRPCSGKNRSKFLIFVPEDYERFPWLTGCAFHCSLYCFPCLLFSYRRVDPWIRGFSDLRSLEKATKTHSKSEAHLFAGIEWIIFKDQTRKNLPIKCHPSVADNNEMVDKNRRALKWIIDQVCILANSESALYRHVMSNEDNNNADYAAFLEAEFHCHIEVSLKSATLFKETSPVIHSSLISSIADVILDYIKSEISRSPFAALVIEETSIGKSQLSTVLRFTDKFEQHDRFIGFTDVSGDRSASALSDHIKTVVSDYGLSGKLVAQTYNGAVVQAGQLNDLLEKVKVEHPHAYFIHPCTVPLGKILEQSTYCIPECRMFYKTISGVAEFFSKSSDMVKKLKEFTIRELFHVDLTQWNFTSKLVQTVSKYRMPLIRFFEYIVSSDDSSTEQVVYARLFSSFLLELDTLFFLGTFSRIFVTSDQLDNFLNCSPHYKHQRKIEQFHIFIRRFQRFGFETIWLNITGYSSQSTRHGSKNPRLDEDALTKYSEIFDHIIERVLEQTEARFRDVGKFKFLSLLDSSKFERYLKTPDITYRLCKKLCRTYNFFDVTGLRAELSIFYSNYARFQGFSSMADGLSQFFPQLSKLLKLLIAIPPTESNIVAIPGSDKLKTISSLHPGPVLTNYSVIAVEHELLKCIRDESVDGEDFYERVISKFALENPHIELVAEI